MTALHSRLFSLRAAFAPLLLCAALALAGCESSEERAERYYRSGLALLEKGEVSQALIEFRNVFTYDIRHKEARATYARVQRERGEIGDAFGQYLRLVEQYPDMLEARVALTQMALEGGGWDEAETHGRAARTLAPADPEVALLNAVLDYRAAVLAKDTAAVEAPLALIRARLVEEPGNLIARRVMLDHLESAQDWAGALAEAEAGIAARPELYEFHAVRLRILAQMGDQDAVGAALKDMAERFPADDQVRTLLVGWYLERKDIDGAEALLRRAAEAPEADTRARLNLVEFLRALKGTPAAMAELDRMIAAGPGPAAADAGTADTDAADAGAAAADAGADDTGVLRALRATLDFEAGRTAEAIAAMRTLLTDRGAGDTPAAAPATTAPAAGTPEAGDSKALEETHNFRIMLSRMLLGTGDAAGAKAQVEAVLAQDPSQVEALKMRAAWLIDEDKPSDAILALRAALAQAPRDASVLTLMGQAHEREGARGLAGERYALAVEVSNRAAQESLRYASFLLADGRTDAAEGVLSEALAVAPQDIGLLQAMSGIYMRKSDWDRAGQTVEQIRALGTPESTGIANGLAADLLMRQDRMEDSIALLQGLVEGQNAGTEALAALVQMQVRDGQTEAARRMLDERLTKTPEDPTLRFLRAGLHLLDEEPEAAEAIYRKLIADLPQNEQPLRVLYGMLISQGRKAEASALVDAALGSAGSGSTGTGTTGAENTGPESTGTETAGADSAATQTSAATAPASVELRLLKAEDLERQNDFEGAIAVYEGLYAENSANQIVANNLASLLVTHRDDSASLDRAFAIARRLRGQAVPAFQDTYGWIEYRRGNFAEALADLEPAAAGLPEDPLVQFHLGMTYAALKRTAEARTALERALEIAGDSPLPQFAKARELLAELPAQ